MSDLAAALAAIHQEHSAVPCSEFTPSSAARWAMCEHCGWESRRIPVSEIRSWDETFRTLDAEHVAALQVAYLRENLAEHAEELGMTVEHIDKPEFLDTGEMKRNPIIGGPEFVPERRLRFAPSIRYVTDWSRNDHA